MFQQQPGSPLQWQYEYNNSAEIHQINHRASLSHIVTLYIAPTAHKIFSGHSGKYANHKITYCKTLLSLSSILIVVAPVLPKHSGSPVRLWKQANLSGISGPSFPTMAKLWSISLIISSLKNLLGISKSCLVPAGIVIVMDVFLKSAPTRASE